MKDKKMLNNLEKDLEMVKFLKETIEVKGYVFMVFGEDQDNKEDFLALYDFNDHMKAIGAIEVVKSMLIAGISGNQKNVSMGLVDHLNIDKPTHKNTHSNWFDSIDEGLDIDYYDDDSGED